MRPRPRLDRPRAAAPRLLSGLLACFALGCGGEPAAEDPRSAPPPPVEIEVVARTPILPTATGTAELLPLRQASLAAEAPGRVVFLGFDRGDHVELGQVLVRLDVGRAATALTAAQAGVAQAEASLAQALREREMAERLAQSGSVSRQALDRARDGERLAEAALASARAQTRVTQRGITEAVIRAPFSGVISERRVELGEFLAPGAPVAILVDRSSLRARVLLDPREALDIGVGAQGEARAFARPDERFEARVRQVGEVVDPRTRRLPVELEVEDPDHRLRPGLVARFTVRTGEPREALTLDPAAVFERFGQKLVYAIRAEIAERRQVRLGATSEGRVEVLEGLAEGDRVVINGQDRVIAGEPVRIVERGEEEAARTAQAPSEPAR